MRPGSGEGPRSSRTSRGPEASAGAVGSRGARGLSSAPGCVHSVILAPRPPFVEQEGPPTPAGQGVLPQGPGPAAPRVCSGGRSPQGAYSTFVYSYAVEKPMAMGHRTAGYLPSLFWGFITLGQLVSIPVSSRVRPATMVFINVVSGLLALPGASGETFAPGPTTAPGLCSGLNSAKGVRCRVEGGGDAGEEGWRSRRWSLPFLPLPSPICTPTGKEALPVVCGWVPADNLPAREAGSGVGPPCPPWCPAGRAL